MVSFSSFQVIWIVFCTITTKTILHIKPLICHFHNFNRKKNYDHPIFITSNGIKVIWTKKYFLKLDIFFQLIYSILYYDRSGRVCRKLSVMVVRLMVVNGTKVWMLTPLFIQHDQGFHAHLVALQNTYTVPWLSSIIHNYVRIYNWILQIQYARELYLTIPQPTNYCYMYCLF